MNCLDDFPAPSSANLALKSSHIFLDDTQDPISGIILISNEKIDEIVPENLLTSKKLEEIQKHYELQDFGDSLIFPGIIDMNVHLNSNFEEKWSNIEEVTRMASQGGITTIVDHPLMNFYNEDFNEKESIKSRIQNMLGKLYVDCGLLGYLGLHNYKNIKEIYEECNILGFKLHLSRTMIQDLPNRKEIP